MSLSSTFSQKAIDAALAAIEIYNKPDFRFREEAFSLLMCNGWELLLKARWLQEHEDNLESLYEIDRGTGQPRLKRCKNPITFGVTYLAAKLLEDSNSGLTKPVFDNLLALIEVRDNSAHFINKDLHFGRRILEIGTASLQNFLRLITEWFQVDMSRYNFFLMPISFYHGFETIQPSSVTPYPVQMSRLMDYIAALCDADKDIEEPGHSVSVRLETRFVRGKDAEAVAFRFTDDPNAPEVTLREEDVLKNYPLDYRKLCDALRRCKASVGIGKKARMR